ncbi:MAG: DUF1926 domain-containing protein [Treponema sp.]|jgi:hypothetical protein|nr:DUF1926 domain-containing protein [Treponema sp.]
MGKIKLILGSHKHIPGGAGDDEFTRIYENELMPFIGTLYQFPHIQLVLHYSGAVFHWLDRFHPECTMLIKSMIARKQVEILGGGFYEPLMPLIPQQDKIGQIELLTTYLRKQFEKRPVGCWLPALAWEQNMISSLSACGMAYTFLDEEQFKLAGLQGKELFFPCISEDQGKTIIIFPLSKFLRKEFVQKNAFRALSDMAEKILPGGDLVVSVFLDQVYRRQGQDQAPESIFHDFFEDLSRCESFVDFISPDKFFRGLQGLRRAYFPNSLGSCLPVEKNAPSQALPRSFLIDFPEANGIYSKMLFTNTLINQLRGDKSRKHTAREELWKAQGCDVFCPTEKYGIGCSSVRKAAYTALIDAERICREKGKFISSLMNFDFDMDGAGEYLFQDTNINCYIQLRGAGIFELDFLPRTWNYLDTFAPGISRERRTAFADRFIPAGISPQALGEGRVAGARLCGQELFEAAGMDRIHRTVRFRLSCREALPFGNIEMEKSYFLKKDTIFVSYTLTNRGETAEHFQLAPEIDLSFPGDGEAFVRFFKNKDTPLAEPAVYDAESIKIQDLKNEVQIILGSKKKFNAGIIPVKAPCKGRPLDMYQSTCFMPLQEVSLPPGETWTTEFTLKFSH